MRWTLLFLLLFSCNFKPWYQRPYMDIPSEWRFESDSASTDCANIQWWKQFNDPVLNDLIALALVNNQNLQLANHFQYVE